MSERKQGFPTSHLVSEAVSTWAFQSACSGLQNPVSRVRKLGTETEFGEFSAPWGQDISLTFPETQIHQCLSSINEI